MAMPMNRISRNLFLLTVFSCLAACTATNGDADGSGDPEGGLLASVLSEPAVESATEPSSPPAEQLTYRVGDEEFSFAAGMLLQTWPDLSVRPMRQYARLAVQMPAEELAPDRLAGLRDVVQVDVLQAALIPEATSVLAAAFTDWAGREEQPAGSTYKFTVTSNRAATGTRLAYLRQYQKLLDLDSLAPFKPQAGAPIYVFGRDGTRITTLIVCEPLPAGYDGPDHCSLRRALDDEIGYRVLFPQDLLVHWRVFDEAARDYVGVARR